MSCMSDWLVTPLNSVVEAISSVLSPIVMHFYISETESVSSSANIGPGQLWKCKQGKCRTPLRLCFAGCQAGLTGPQPPQWDGGEKGREVGRLPDDLADQVTQLQLLPPRLSSALLTNCQTIPPFRKHPSIWPAGPRAPGTSQGCSCVPISCQGVPCPNWGETGKGEQGRRPRQTDSAMNSRGAGGMWSGPTDLSNLSQLGQNWDVYVVFSYWVTDLSEIFDMLCPIWIWYALKKVPFVLNKIKTKSKSRYNTKILSFLQYIIKYAYLEN